MTNTPKWTKDDLVEVVTENINDTTNNEAELLYEDDEGTPYADLLVEEEN